MTPSPDLDRFPAGLGPAEPPTLEALQWILSNPFAKLILLFYDHRQLWRVSASVCLVIRLILFPVFLKGRKSMLSMSGLAEKQQELAKKYAETERSTARSCKTL